MKPLHVLFGPYQGTLITLEDDQADRAVAEGWALDIYGGDYPQSRDYTAQDVADATTAAWGAWGQWQGVLEPPTLASITPSSAVLGDPDLTMTCRGTGYTPQSIIMFAGETEPIDFVSDTEITTIVKPSLGWGAVTVPVSVRNADGTQSQTRNFTFTEPVEPPAREQA